MMAGPVDGRFIGRNRNGRHFTPRSRQAGRRRGRGRRHGDGLWNICDRAGSGIGPRRRDRWRCRRGEHSAGPENRRAAAASDAARAQPNLFVVFFLEPLSRRLPHLCQPQPQLRRTEPSRRARRPSECQLGRHGEENGADQSRPDAALRQARGLTGYRNQVRLHTRLFRGSLERARTARLSHRGSRQASSQAPSRANAQWRHRRDGDAEQSIPLPAGPL